MKIRILVFFFINTKKVIVKALQQNNMVISKTFCQYLGHLLCPCPLLARFYNSITVLDPYLRIYVMYHECTPYTAYIYYLHRRRYISILHLYFRCFIIFAFILMPPNGRSLSVWLFIKENRQNNNLMLFFELVCFPYT